MQLYFLAGNTAKDIAYVLYGYACRKFMFGQTSACFILPRRTAEWNSRVVHMQRLGSDNDIHVCKTDIVDAAAHAKHAGRMSSNQHVHNVHFASQLVTSRMRWEFLHDAPVHHGDVLTSRWHAKLASLSTTSSLIQEHRRTLSAKSFWTTIISPITPWLQQALFSWAMALLRPSQASSHQPSQFVIIIPKSVCMLQS